MNEAGRVWPKVPWENMMGRISIQAHKADSGNGTSSEKNDTQAWSQSHVRDASDGCMSGSGLIRDANKAQ